MENTDKELLQQLLEKFGAGGTFVFGDQVTNKYVENEIGYVEAGGIGIQINNGAPKEASGQEDTLPTREAMIQAVEATEKEGLWWSSRSWAVVFRVYQMKGYKGSISEFVREVKAWGLKNDHECNYDAVQKPVASGVLSGTPERWKANGAQGQTVKLAEALLKELEKD